MFKKIYFAGGCFWCTEAVFKRVKGVDNVIPGYIGGSIKNPAYREIITGRTGHAEAIEITYEPSIVDVSTLLDIFFSTHDPTTLNRQGNDVGTQYRSAIFFTEEAQKKSAVEIIKVLIDNKVFENPIVTELLPAPTFYHAEKDHWDFYDTHGGHSYCNYVIDPKIQKLKKYFSTYITV